MPKGFFTTPNALEQAESYSRGKDVKRDLVAAEALYKQAIQEKLPGAHFRMGLFYHRQSGRDAEAAEAYFNAFMEGGLQAKAALEELALLPSATAHFYLGRIFETTQEPAKAEQAYLMASEGGSVLALFHLAKCYEADPKRAFDALQYYQGAWLKGYEPALLVLQEQAKTNAMAALFLARGYEIQTNNERALHYYKQASRLGNVEAAFRLGELEGKLEHYVLAAQRGHRGAVDILQRRAQAGEAEAQYLLGARYYHPKNQLKEAALWCMRAAEQRHSPALRFLNETQWTVPLLMMMAEAHEKGEGVAVNLERAMEFYQKAGASSALLKLGLLCELKDGDQEKNIAAAYRYYLSAAHSGCLDALDSLERLAETGTSEMKAGLVQLYRSPGIHRPMEALRWEAKMGVAPTSGTLTYASPAVTTFFRPTAMRKTVGDLSTKIHQFNLGAE